MNARIFLCLSALAPAMFAGSAAAQIPVARTAVNVDALEPIKLDKLTPIADRYDARIEAAFKGNEKLKAAMQAELRAISVEKDAVKRAAMVKAYRTKYSSQYSAVLRAGNVDLSAMAREMSAAVPDLSFTVKDGFAITGKLTAKPGTTLTLGTSTGRSTTLSTGTPTLSTETTATLNDRDFEGRTSNNCGVVSGQNSSAANNAIRLFSYAIEAGGCVATGTRKYEFEVDDDEEVVVSGTLDSSAETYALGLLGLARSRSSTDVYVSRISNSGRTLDSAGTKNFGDSYAFAPFLAADDDKDNLSNGRFEVTIREPGRYSLLFIARADTFAGGVVAGTTASADMTRITTKITRRKK